jgi:formamidopyrimidine-DNA glycosylase
MPELPEVETVAQGLARAMQGRRIAQVRLNRADLRLPLPRDFAGRLTGQRVATITRRAKYILVQLSGGESLLIHLGMTGRFTVIRPNGNEVILGEVDEETEPRSGNHVHDHVVFSLDDGTRIVYTDPRRFGVMDLTSDSSAHPLTLGLGIEPLGGELTPAYLADIFLGRKAPLKSTLMDQRLIAGLGNIYVCEALFRAGLSPRRKAGSLVRSRKSSDPRLAKLARAIRAVLTDAIAAGGSTLRDYAGADGSLGSFQNRFRVYDREGKPCLRPGCGGTIKRIVQSGRSTFYCSRCQR